MTKRIRVDLTTGKETVENYSYDAAGNITDDGTAYDTNNRIVRYGAETVSYDKDGNMLSDGTLDFRYDSANRLVSAGEYTYTYDAEDMRIRVRRGTLDTKYVYNTNARLSQLLMKDTNGVVSKYVYGLGFIGEEKRGKFTTYHFDYRGSTVAITDDSGAVTDTYEYDSYGRVTSHRGKSSVIFTYNGRDGVVTDGNRLIYMRARYYSPAMRRFINADILYGNISDSTSLNRYAYVNGNPVSFVDPFGLSAERGQGPSVLEAAYMASHVYNAVQNDAFNGLGKDYNGWQLEYIHENEEGLKIGIYYKIGPDDTISYSLAFAGSEIRFITHFDDFYNDWVKNNFTQPFGNSQVMIDALAFANDFVKKHPDAHITFIGHSKGGAEAAAAAVATKNDSILFNPATVNLSAYGLELDNYSGDMTAYIVEGEVLDSIFGSFSDSIYDKVFIKEDGVGVKMLKQTSAGRVYNLVESFFDHSMRTVIRSLKREGYT